MPKYTILMLPSWYPTKEKPMNGTFFREQAIALQKEFNFIVLLNREQSVIWFSYFLQKIFGFMKPAVSFLEDDSGMKVYEYKSYKPRFLFLPAIADKVKKRLRKNMRQCVGKTELNFFKKLRLSNIVYLKKHGKLEHFDAVYGLTAQDMAPLTAVFAKVYGVPYIVAEHGPFPFPGTLLTDSIIEAIEGADKFFAISNDKIRQVMMQDIHIKPYYVGNLVDETKFSLMPVSHEVKTFLIVAAYSFYKNYDLFIQAMEELKRISYKNFKIVICGYNANKGYSKNAEELENRVRNSCIAPHTEMIEAVDRAEIPQIYNRADIFVMTSIQEGMPVSALEASVCGLPVFSTRCGGVEDYIDESMGRIFPITDYRALANACNDYLNGKIKFDNQKIRAKAISHFGNKAFTENMSRAFYDIIKGGTVSTKDF